MKKAVPLIFLFIAISTSQSIAQLDVFPNYNQNFLIIISSPSVEDKLYKEQIKILNSIEEEIDRRDVGIFRIFPKEGISPENQYINTIQHAQLKSIFDLSDTDFTIFFLAGNGNIIERRQQLISKNELLRYVVDLPVRENAVPPDNNDVEIDFYE